MLCARTHVRSHNVAVHIPYRSFRSIQRAFQVHRAVYDPSSRGHTSGSVDSRPRTTRQRGNICIPRPYRKARRTARTLLRAAACWFSFGVSFRYSNSNINVLWTRIHVYMCLYTCTHVLCSQLHIYMYCVYIHVYVCIYMCICIICMYVCIHVLYVYIYISVHELCVYMYTHTSIICRRDFVRNPLIIPTRIGLSQSQEVDVLKGFCRERVSTISDFCAIGRFARSSRLASSPPAGR